MALDCYGRTYSICHEGTKNCRSLTLLLLGQSTKTSQNLHDEHCFSHSLLACIDLFGFNSYLFQSRLEIDVTPILSLIAYI